MFQKPMSILVLLFTLSLVTPAPAHFLFIRIVESPKKERVAEVYFSDTATAGDPRFIDKIAATKLWLQEKPGVFKPLKIRKGKDRLRAALPANGPAVVVGSCTYGVLPRKTPFLLRHFPKAIAGAPKELEAMRPFKKVPLEIVSSVKNGKLHVLVLRKGKPMPHAEIYTLAKDLSGTKYKCGADGRGTWTPPKAGWYMIYTSDFKKEAGSYRGRKYQEIRDFATLSFEWLMVGKRGR